jgi:hypothetical protein
MHFCNPSTQTAETRGSQVQGQPGIHSEFLSQTNKRMNWKPKDRKSSNPRGLDTRTEKDVSLRILKAVTLEGRKIA